MAFRYFKIVDKKIVYDGGLGHEYFIKDLFLMAEQMEKFKVVKKAMWDLLPKILSNLKELSVECSKLSEGIELVLAKNDMNLSFIMYLIYDKNAQSLNITLKFLHNYNEKDPLVYGEIYNETYQW